MYILYSFQCRVGVELLACTVVRCRVLVSSYLRVEWRGVESVSSGSPPKKERVSSGGNSLTINRSM